MFVLLKSIQQYYRNKIIAPRAALVRGFAFWQYLTANDEVDFFDKHYIIW